MNTRHRFLFPTLVVAVSGLAGVMALTRSVTGEAPVLRGASERGSPIVPRGPVSLDALPASAAGARAAAIEATDLVGRKELPTGRFGPDVPTEGRTAALAGTLTVEGEGAPLTLELTAGANRGVTVSCAADGTFQAPALFPGFAAFTVRGVGGGDFTREVLLRHRQETVLDVDFADHGVVHGEVRDRDGKPVGGALVSLDGFRTTADSGGGFSVPRRASGAPLLVVEQEGYASYRRSVDRMHDSEGRPLEVELRKGCRLELTVATPTADLIGGGTTVYLIPGAGQRLTGTFPQSAYPWHLLNPVQVPESGRIVLHDLPGGRLDVHAYDPRGTAAPVQAFLRPGKEARIAVSLDPIETLAGQVLAHGEPVEGAGVRLTFANPMKASQATLGEVGKHYMTQPLELSPQAGSSVRTRHDGSFELGVDRRIRGVRFLTVTSPDGGTECTRELQRGQTSLVVELGDPLGSATP